MPGNYSILLIGLNPQAEAFARRHFAGLKQPVSTASTLAEAEEMLANPEHEIVFFETELNDGATAALRRLQSVRPGLPVILTTGYSEEVPLLNPAVEKGVAVLQKPYTPKLLAQKIRELLDRN